MSANSVLYNSASVTLDWADVSGANGYHLQVATKPDFSGTLLEDDSGLAVSTKSFTDGGTDDSKRWWRWRYTTDGGTTWSEWSEVGSYWMDTGATAEVTLGASKWAMFDTDPVTDLYQLEDYPKYSVMAMQFNRAKERNRRGTMFTEWFNSKDKVVFQFDDSLFMSHRQMRAFKRFNTEIKTFFLATYKSNGLDNVQNIWKMVFQDDPEFAMLAAGREDYFTGEVAFEEV
jgi:hypothetical protein